MNEDFKQTNKKNVSMYKFTTSVNSQCMKNTINFDLIHITLEFDTIYKFFFTAIYSNANITFSSNHFKMSKLTGGIRT